MAAELNPQMSLAEQAAHWWVVLNDANVSAGERREFSEWLTRGPDRIAAYLRTEMVMKAVRSPRVQWPDTPPEDLVRAAKTSHAPELPSLKGVPAAVRHSTERRFRWSHLAMAAATSALLALGAAWFVLTGQQGEFHTAFGEQRAVLLEDGSRIELNSESRVKVELGRNRRLVTLEAGEALFQIAHDPERPYGLVT